MRRVLVGILVGLVSLAAVAWFGGRAYLGQSVAQYSGEVQVAGISHPIDITFDEKGIPQVWAQTDEDAYFALGWLHASERLFQMELLRRMASGTLSELFGGDAFATDVRQRRIGFHLLGERVLEEADPPSLSVLDAYVRGVNTWIDQTRVLPPEFVLLRTRPRKWTPLDVTTAFVYQSWYPTELADRRVANRMLVDRLGDEVADLLAVPRDWMIPSAGDGGLSGLLDPNYFPMRMTEATNNWAVAPERSASGHAIHAADPHLAINGIPGFWYIAGLRSAEGLDVVGITSPGVPVFAMGHNGQSAWSFSVAPLILTDHYAETFHPTDTLQVRTPDGYATMEVRSEEILVQGEDEPRIVPVYHTSRGVLIEHGLIGGTSMHWSGYDLVGGDGLAAALEIAGVSRFDNFRGLTERLPTFSVNWIYTDREGTIGYQLGPVIPDRTYSPAIPQDAVNAEAAWLGYHPPEMRPWTQNPGRGWVATTNNPPASADWPVPLYGNYNLMRMRRVEAWFDERPLVDFDYMRQMQLDFVSGRALQWRELMADGAEHIGEDGLADRLRAWPGTVAPDDTLATIFAYWTQSMTRHLFEDELGPDWPTASVLRDIVLMENITRFINDGRTGEVETATNISARAMHDALRTADGRPFGEIQSLTMVHPLSRAPMADRLLNLNRGPFARGGDSETLNLSGAAFIRETQTFEARVAPSMRFVMDWADVDAFSITIPLGQSGNPFSPHYDDFLPLFDGNDPWTVPFSREAVEARATSTLRLSLE